MASSAERLVKWSAEARDFWESAPDDGVVLNVVISHGCASQTGEGFEELVNSLNGEPIRKKIKKVVITDASYLYRHSIPFFDKHLDASVPTIWFLNNKDAISKIAVETELKSWADGVARDKVFERWRDQIKVDFLGDKDGNGIDREFRELVIADAAVAAYKNDCSFDKCVDFLLEESAYVCAHLRNSVLVYPIVFTPSFLYLTNRYAHIRQLCYKISKQAQRNRKDPLESRADRVDKAIVFFMKETVSNVNFYVINKHGNYICRNREFLKVTGEKINAEELDETSWRACLDVIESKKQIIVEEQFNGTVYLSVKAPLMINGEVEGVIGLAVDVTDRKRAQELEILVKSQEKEKILAEQVAHDIRSPLIVLGKLAEGCPDISEKDHAMLRNVVTSIEMIAEDLLDKYASRDESDKRLR